MYCGNWRSENGSMRWPKIVAAVIGGIAMIVLFAAGFGLAVQSLWNWLMPALFHLPEIDYYQAFGLIVLARLLIGGFGGRSGHRGHRRFNRHFTGKHGFDNSCRPEDFENWKHYDVWWNTQGKESFQNFVDSQKTEQVKPKSKKR